MFEMSLIKSNTGYFFKNYIFYAFYDNGLPLYVRRYDFLKNEDIEINLDAPFYIYECCNPFVFEYNNKYYMILSVLSVEHNYSLMMFVSDDLINFNFVKIFAFLANSPYIYNDYLYFGKAVRKNGLNCEYVYKTDFKNLKINKIEKLQFFYRDFVLDFVFSFSHYRDNLFFGSSLVSDDRIYINFLFEEFEKNKFRAVYYYPSYRDYKIKYSKEYNIFLYCHKLDYITSVIRLEKDFKWLRL